MACDKDYLQSLKNESLYWGNFEVTANFYGIPWWCDLRRATKLTPRVDGWMSDPETEKILRGKYKSKLIRLAAAGNVLDLGCGAGWLSLELARAGAYVDGIELSQQRIEIATRYLQANPYLHHFGAVNYQVGDINNLLFKSNYYHSVVCWDSLHHIPDIDRLVFKIYQSLRPQGFLLIYDHIGLEPPNRRLIKILQIPFYIKPKIKSLFTRKAKLAVSPVDDMTKLPVSASPFEDVTGIEMVSAIKKYFCILELKTELCVLAKFANDLLVLPDFLLYPGLKVLKLVDTILIRLHLLRGEYIFIFARKK